MKKAEREDLWARVDAQAQEVFRDDTAMKGFENSFPRNTQLYKLMTTKPDEAIRAM